MMLNSKRLSSIIGFILLITAECSKRDNLNYHFDQKIEKKAVAETVLLGLQVLEGAIMIYRGENSCSDAVGNLEVVKKEYVDILIEMKNMRDAINIRWGNVKEVRRYSNRLNSSSQVIEILAANIISATDEISQRDELKSNYSGIVDPENGGKNALIVRPRLQLSKAKNAINVMSKAAEELAGGLAIIAVLVNFGVSTSIHHDSCLAQKEAYKKELKKIKVQKNIMVGLKKHVERIYKETLKEYKLSKEVFLQLTAIEWLDKMEKSLSNHPDLKNSTEMRNLKAFLQDYYKLDPNTLDMKLTEISSKWLTNLLRKSRCKKEKKLLVKKLVWHCAKGNIKLHSFLANEINKITVCNLNNERWLIMEKVNQKLRALNKNEICSRNSESKRKLVCQLKNNRNGIVDIKAKTGFENSDILYFWKHCSKLEVPTYGKSAICNAKKEGHDLKKVLHKFSEWNSDIVAKIYSNCSLDNSQTKLICAYKQGGEKLLEIQRKFHFYNQSKVTFVYDGCKEEISPGVKQILCIMKSNSYSINTIINMFKTAYKAELITQTFNTCN